MTAEGNPAVTGWFLSRSPNSSNTDALGWGPDPSHSPKASAFVSISYTLDLWVTIKWSFHDLSPTGNTVWHLGAACRMMSRFWFHINAAWILTPCRFIGREGAVRHKPASLGAVWSSTHTRTHSFLVKEVLFDCSQTDSEAKSAFTYCSRCTVKVWVNGELH